ELEHHANIVPWQLVAEKRGIRIEAVRIDDQGRLDEDDLRAKLRPPTRLFAFTGCSNALGVKADVHRYAAWAREQGVTTLLDAAQLVAHGTVNMTDWGVDFMVFSAHKIFGPTGLGILCGRRELLEGMPPWQGGGSMISQVTLEKTSFNDVPLRFEAGTP